MIKVRNRIRPWGKIRIRIQGAKYTTKNLLFLKHKSVLFERLLKHLDISLNQGKKERRKNVASENKISEKNFRVQILSTVLETLTGIESLS